MTRYDCVLDQTTAKRLTRPQVSLDEKVGVLAARLIASEWRCSAPPVATVISHIEGSAPSLELLLEHSDSGRPEFVERVSCFSHALDMVLHS